MTATQQIVTRAKLFWVELLASSVSVCFLNTSFTTLWTEGNNKRGDNETSALLSHPSSTHWLGECVKMSRPNRNLSFMFLIMSCSVHSSPEAHLVSSSCNQTKPPMCVSDTHTHTLVTYINLIWCGLLKMVDWLTRQLRVAVKEALFQ